MARNGPDPSHPPLLVFPFFPCSSVGKSTTRTQRRLSLGVELVGAISVLGDYESGAADIARGRADGAEGDVSFSFCWKSSVRPAMDLWDRLYPD